MYILLITNIAFNLIIRKIMKLLINKFDCINLKNQIIETTATFEMRISKGTRYIIQMEAYLIKIIYILNIYYKDNIIKKNL